MSKELKLPEHLREKLSKPFGDLIRDVDKLNLKSFDLVICVGDKTSERILTLGLKPKVCIYDGMVMRKSIKIPEVIKNFKAAEIHVKNPAGYITQELIDAVERAVKSEGNFKIFVEGEEDLATLTAMDIAPTGSVILYGQPGQGMVVVNVDKKAKEFAKGILSKMVRIKI